MSNRLFQGVVHQMRDTIGRVIGVIDENSTIVACSELSRIGTNSDFFTIELGDSHDVFIRDGYTYKPFGVHVKPDYAVFIEGTDDQAAKYASILAISLSSIKQYYDEKYDRNNFVKNIILDNVLPGDITLKARELHFNADISRVVFLISIDDRLQITLLLHQLPETLLITDHIRLIQLVHDILVTQKQVVQLVKHACSSIKTLYL